MISKIAFLMGLFAVSQAQKVRNCVMRVTTIISTTIDQQKSLVNPQNKNTSCEMLRRGKRVDYCVEMKLI